MSKQRPHKITVHDMMQSGYTYTLTVPAGRSFDAEFDPDLTPKEMLRLGVFGGKYMTDCKDEFPDSWFTNAKLCSERHDPEINYFGVNASKPLSYWKKKGWINEPHDPRGWFQWYCRYYRGRRLPEEDERQISRWKQMRRHIGQLTAHCTKGDKACRPKQRQALLHWAYDSRKM